MKRLTTIIIIFLLAAAIAACFYFFCTAEVCFDSDGGSSVESVRLIKGSSVGEPDQPVRDGYVFLYWKLGEYRYNFGAKVREDLVLTAAYKKVCTVTFSFGNGSDDEVMTVDYGSCTDRISDPVKEGFGFAGWTLNGELFDFDTVINEDITLSAKWVKDIIKPASISFADAGKSIIMDKGAVYTVAVEILPSGVNSSSLISYSSSDEKVAVIDNNGTITAVGAGKAIIYAVTENGKMCSAELYVNGVRLYSTLDYFDHGQSLVYIDKDGQSAAASCRVYIESWNNGVATPEDVTVSADFKVSENASYILCSRDSSVFNISCSCSIYPENDISGYFHFEYNGLSTADYSFYIEAKK